MYRAFISYSHSDRAWADWLHKALETWRAPSRLVGKPTPRGPIPRRLAPVFRDREELASATDLTVEIDEALAQSENLIVICSPAAATSRWVNEEVLTFKRMGRGARIFCLIVAGEPHATRLAGRADEECFCPALRGLGEGGDPSQHGEPVAADVRPGRDGKGDARLKLIAGMLGLGFDALKQREQHRRVQRMIVVTALALAVTATTSVLAIFALASRHDAVVARQKAVAAQQVAERREAQAEDLIGFMLGDLYDRLDEMQRLDLIQRVNDKAMAYFASLPPAEVRDASLLQRAKALEQIGAVRLGSGNLTGALEAFHASMRISRELVAARPDDPERQVAYARTMSFVGLAHWNQGNLDAAEHDFEGTREQLAQFVASHGDNLHALFQLALLENNLGNVHEARGQLDAAARHYRERVRLAQRLVAAAPRNGGYQADLGNAHGSLGRLALLRGDLLTAIAEYRADDAIEARLWQADTTDNIQRKAMLEARAILGRTLALAGENAAGEKLLAEAVDMARQLVRFAPENAEFKVDLALYSSQLARLRRLAGRQREAAALSAHAFDLLGGLVAKDSGNSQWQVYFADVAIEDAAEALARGDAALARARAGTALAAVRPILAKRPHDPDATLLAMAASVKLAAAMPDPRAARDLLDLALAEHSAPANGGDPRLMSQRVEALLLRKRNAEAMPAIAWLRQRGYRDGELLAALRRARIDYPPDRVFQAQLLQASHAAPAATTIPPSAPPASAGQEGNAAPPTHPR